MQAKIRLPCFNKSKEKGRGAPGRCWRTSWKTEESVHSRESQHLLKTASHYPATSLIGHQMDVVDSCFRGVPNGAGFWDGGQSPAFAAVEPVDQRSWTTSAAPYLFLCRLTICFGLQGGGFERVGRWGVLSARCTRRTDSLRRRFHLNSCGRSEKCLVFALRMEGRLCGTLIPSGRCQRSSHTAGEAAQPDKCPWRRRRPGRTQPVSCRPTGGDFCHPFYGSFSFPFASHRL